MLVSFFVCLFVFKDKVKVPLSLCFRSDLGKSVNTDEAAALGAVYQAAYLGKGFKVKTFHVRDANIFPINVSATYPPLIPIIVSATYPPLTPI